MNVRFWPIAVTLARRYDRAMYRPPHNIQLKSFPSVTRTKHLRSKCESHFDPRRLRRL